MHSVRRAIACIGLSAVSSVALAQSYPEKTVRVVVPYSAGGSADILARLVGKSLGAHFGQSFLIDNRGGAGGVIAHVAYKGSPPALMDLMAGQTDMMIDVLISALPHVKAGKLRALALTSASRSPLAPNVPTMQEAGVKDFDTGTWFGLLALAGTNRQIITSIAGALDNAMAQTGFTTAVASQGGELGRLTTEQFGELIKSDYAKWGKVVKAAGIKNE